MQLGMDRLAVFLGVQQHRMTPGTGVMHAPGLSGG
jgi:hypothetical protein